MKKNITTPKTPEANLVPGSLYSKENLAFIRQTQAIADDLYQYLKSDPIFKRNPRKKVSDSQSTPKAWKLIKFPTIIPH